MERQTSKELSPQINNAKVSNQTSKSKPQTKSDLQRRLEEDVLMATRVGDAEWLQQCLETTKFSLDFTDSDGLSAIHLAALDCRIDCLKILIEKMNVITNYKSPDGWTCLHLTINNLTPKRSLVCVDYLLACGADPSSATTFGITPMHQAAACGNVACLQSLIDAGGLIDGEDERGHTPFTLATIWGYRECARILKHFQWRKDKRSEEIDRKMMQKDGEVKAMEEKERLQRENTEKRLNGQKAFLLWLSKNQFLNVPLLFGQHAEVEESVHNRRSPAARQKTSISKGHKPHASPKSKVDSSPATAGTNRNMELIPINVPGSPSQGRKHLSAHDKRSLTSLVSGRMKTTQKRGPLQFPVI